MKVDLTQEEISWIEHLCDKSIGHWEDDLRDKHKNHDIAIDAIKETLKVYNKLQDYA